MEGVSRSLCPANPHDTVGNVEAPAHHRTGLEEALRILRQVGDIPEIARVQSEMGWTALATGDADAALTAFCRAVRTNEQVGSPRGPGLALMGLAAVEADQGRPERAVEIAAVAQALSARAGVAVQHPMAPGLAERIANLRDAVPKSTLEALDAKANTLKPADVLAMFGPREPGSAGPAERSC